MVIVRSAKDVRTGCELHGRELDTCPRLDAVGMSRLKAKLVENNFATHVMRDVRIVNDGAIKQRRVLSTTARLFARST